MKRKIIAGFVLGFLLLPLQGLAAPQVKLKYIGSIYTDAAGIALRQPNGATADDRQLVVADSAGKRVLTFSIQAGVVTPEKVFPVPEMFPLMALPVAGGEIYVLDGRSLQIYRLDAAGGIKGKFSPKGMPDNQRMVPRSISLASDGSLLVLDIFSERVLVFDRSGNFQRQLPFPKPYGAFADVTIDQRGNIYLLDSVNAVVYQAGKNDTELKPYTGSLKKNMNFPTSLAADSFGSLYLVDKYGSGLAVLGADGNFAGRSLGMGWNDSQLYYPSQVSINDSGDLFIADTQNNRIQHFRVSE